MKDKYVYIQGFNVNSKEDIDKSVAVYSAFTEGLQLFASLAILLDFSRYNKLKGRFSVFISNLSKRGRNISLEGKLNTPSIVES